jgi:antitoxin component YwqK of YwqJK toxin-antitoxin module
MNVQYNFLFNLARGVVVSLLFIQLFSCSNSSNSNAESIVVHKVDGVYRLQIDSLSLDIFINNNGELGQFIVARDSVAIKKEIIFFFEHEKLNMIENSMNGELHGGQIGLHQSGKISSFHSYNRGLEYDKFICWDDSSNKVVEGVYNKYSEDDTLRDRTIEIFSSDGKYMDGLLECRKCMDGEWLHWYASGKIERKEYYRNGKRIGIWKFYNKQGEVTNEIDYEKTPFVPPN